MKKVLVPVLLMAVAMGLAQRQANAGSFSIGISIGDSHRHGPAQVISAPPVIVAQPAPVCAQPVVVAPPVCSEPVVVVQPRPYWDRGYVAVRECDRVPYRHYPHDWRGHSHYQPRYEHHRR